MRQFHHLRDNGLALGAVVDVPPHVQGDVGAVHVAEQNQRV